jgi:hypothetical protein
MAEKRTESSGTEKGKEPEQPVPDPPMFAVEDLIEGARGLFGVSPHLAAGAFSKARKHLTMADAIARVEQFASQEID